MIVVIGALAARELDGEVVPSGSAATIANAAARAGATVEVIARVGDDPDGDGLLLALAGAGIGHVAVLRDPSRHTDVQGADADDDAAPGSADPDPGTDLLQPAAGSPTLEAADVGLAMRYLTDFGVVALVHPSDDAIVATVLDAVSWATAHLVVVVDPASSARLVEALPAEAVIVEAGPDAEGPGILIGRYLAAIDAGTPPADAFATLRAAG